jgi:poly(hydroxyalkanoate) granule-associated protein
LSLAELPDELAERGREIWLSGLGALSMVEEEGVKLFNSLVEKGEAWQQEGKKQVGTARKKLDEALEKVEASLSDVVARGSKLSDLDDKLLATVEERVEKALKRLGVPTHAEVKDLSSKVAKLSSEVTTLAAVLEGTRTGGGPGVFHVVPHDAGWAIKQEGVEAPLGVYGTKNEALAGARTTAQQRAPSRLVTHKKDGTVQNSQSYKG